MLENTRLPYLHTLRAYGGLEENWDGLFSSSEMSPLRIFLLRHPTLRTIAFENYRNKDFHCSPKNVEIFLPSLRDFAAAPALCEAVIHSPLAAQIQALRITGIKDNQMHLIPQALRLMPELRIFSARFSFGGGSARTSAEKHLNVKHPHIEELELEPTIDNFELLVGALSFFPNLRLLAINLDLPRRVRAREWPDYVQILVDKCPRLQRVSECYRATPGDYWVVNNRNGGVAEIIRVPAIGDPVRNGKEYSSAFE
ncbi:hypothetical protein FRC09_007627 [Ceratobasidium sp. 395]|nr:hypothetical protein FRC09_007627 [Ceratobasidium sp. 395]